MKDTMKAVVFKELGSVVLEDRRSPRSCTRRTRSSG